MSTVTVSTKVVKTIILSLVSTSGLQNATAPATISSLASSADTTSLNATRTAPTNAGAACDAELKSYTSASNAWEAENWSYSTFTTTTEYDNTTLSTWLYSCTSSCGSHIGAVTYCDTPTTIISTTHVSTAFETSRWTGGVYPTPAPSCSIASSDCSDLWATYDSSFTSWLSITEPSRSLAPSPVFPECTYCVPTGCTFAHGGMDLYYFPVTATKNMSRDMCTDWPAGSSATNLPDPDTTYTEVTTGLSTVVDGITMYEGNVYLSISEPFVTDGCRGTIAPKYTKPRIITMASSDLFTVRGYPHNVIPFSMNYGDLVEPVPWSAYVGGQYCANNRVACSEVFPGHYNPVMSMPGQIRQLDPNWASCEFDKYGIFDPPIALTGVPNFLTSSSVAVDPAPTSAEPIVTDPATPGQTSGSGPTITSGPEPTSSPNDPEDPVPSDPATPNDPAPSDPATPVDPQDPVPSSPQMPDPQPSTPVTPQDPAPSDPSTPNDPEVPTPDDPSTPTDPQEPIPSSPSNPQEPTPGSPQVPSDPQNPAPVDPQNPSPSNPQVPSDPQNPVPVDPQNPPSGPEAPNDPENPPASPEPQNPQPNTDANPTGDAGNSPGSPTPPAITVGPTVIPVDPTGGLIIDPGTTLSNGGEPVVISSSTFSIGTGGLIIVSPETSTEIPIENDPITVPAGPSASSFVITPSDSSIVLGGTTLSEGGKPVTVDDTTLSIGSSGVVVVNPSGTSTIVIPTDDSATPSRTDATTSQTGTVEFPGAAAKLNWNAASLVGVVFGMMGLAVL